MVFVGRKLRLYRGRLRSQGILQGMAPATKAAKSAAERRAAAERTRGMFAHLALGVSLADELIAERRAEARAEERAERQRAER